MTGVNFNYKKKAYDELQKEYESRIEEVEQEIQNLQVEEYKYKIKQNIYSILHEEEKMDECSKGLKKIKDEEKRLVEEGYNLDREYEKFKRLKSKFETHQSL